MAFRSDYSQKWRKRTRPKNWFYISLGISKKFVGPSSTLSKNQNFQKSDFPNVFRFWQYFPLSVCPWGLEYIDHLFDSFFKTWLLLRAGVGWLFTSGVWQICSRAGKFSWECTLAGTFFLGTGKNYHTSIFFIEGFP